LRTKKDNAVSSAFWRKAAPLDIANSIRIERAVLSKALDVHAELCSPYGETPALGKCNLELGKSKKRTWNRPE